MKSIVVLALIALSFTAHAHFKIGTYQGSKNGEPCLFTIRSVDFTGGVRHPLNEKVEIDIHFANESRVFTHLAIVNHIDGTVRPKKEILSAVTANQSGANAFEMHMNENGPFQMIYISDVYRDQTQSKTETCGALQYIGN